MHRGGLGPRRASGVARALAGDSAWSTLEQQDRWAVETVEIELTTVDAEVERLGLRPTLVKIDVEGHELAVLTGMQATLELRPAVLCEVGVADPALVEEIFSTSGCRTYRIAGRRLVAGSLAAAPGVFNALLLPADCVGAAP